jgi:hypothetical protein
MLGGTPSVLDANAQVAALARAKTFKVTFTVNGVKSTWNGVVLGRPAANQLTVKSEEAAGSTFTIPVAAGVTVHEIEVTDGAVDDVDALERDLLGVQDQGVQPSRALDLNEGVALGLNPKRWGEMDRNTVDRVSRFLSQEYFASLSGTSKYWSKDVLVAVRAMMLLASNTPVLATDAVFLLGARTLLKRLVGWLRDKARRPLSCGERRWMGWSDPNGSWSRIAV